MKFSLIDGMKKTTTTEGNFSTLLHVITNCRWAPSLFNGDRSNANFQQTEILALDIDDGMPISKAVEIYRDFRHIIATSKSHQKEKITDSGKVKPPCDRYRVILFLDAPCTSVDAYRATWDSAFDLWPFIDEGAKDAARFFYPSPGLFSNNENGSLFPISPAKPKIMRPMASKKSDFIPAFVLNIKMFGIENGSRNRTVFRASCECARALWEFEDIYNYLRDCTDLPDNELQTAINQGIKAVQSQSDTI
jgi:hypothetical protein